MFSSEMRNFHWLVLAWGGGLIAMIAIALSYATIWRPREEEREKAQRPLRTLHDWIIWFFAVFPWILLLTYIGATALAITLPLLKAVHPPNW